jgi:uncharacterized protein YdaU (DUF1376 family)
MYYYQHHIGDYAGATAHLSWLEDAAYRRLLELYYRQEKPLCNDLKWLCRNLRATTKDQKQAVESVLKEFFALTEEGWRHSHCDAELERMAHRAEQARASAGARWRNRRVRSGMAEGAVD